MLDLTFVTPFLPAPMEGFSDPPYINFLLKIGGCGAIVTRFVRVNSEGGCSPMLDKVWLNTGNTPFIVQLLGRDPAAMAQIAEEIQNRGATAIDMNCGCPSRTVTKKGCGSALLDEPEQLKKILHALRSALTIPLTLKIRRGFKDSANFDRILDIAEDCGVDLVTIHPRLTTEMYNGKADWSYIDRAVQKLSIPVVGNGDIKTAIEACKRLKNHGCKAVMIGRSALADPYLFEQATQLFKGNEYTPSTPQQLVEFFDQLMAKYEKNYKSENMALARGKGHLRYLDWERFSLDDAALRPIFRSKTVVDFLTKLKNMLNQ